MRSLTRRERILSGVTLSVVLAAGIFMAVIEPLLNRHTELQDEVSALEVSLARMRANMQLRHAIEARYERLEDVIRESGTPEQEMARFARLLSGLYRPLGIQPRSIRPLPDVDELYYSKLTLRIEMEGMIADVVKFLSAAAETPEPIRVERVELACKELPDRVTASLVVSKLVTTGKRSQVTLTQANGGDRFISTKKGFKP